MASIQFSRSNATTVWANATNCTASHTYTIQVYSGGTWWDKVTNLYGKASYLKSFSVSGSDSYSARLWDETIHGVAATGSIPKWETSNDVKVIIKNYLNVTTELTDGSYTGQADTSFSIMTSGTQYQTYANQYIFKYYTLSSENYSRTHGVNEPIVIKAGLQVKVYYETEVLPHPYMVTIFIDGSAGQSTTNTTNTQSSIVVSSLPAYALYANDYDFQYAKVRNSSIQYSANSTIALTANSTTYIDLYFKTKTLAVAPVITQVTTTSTTALVSWSKNGGTKGVWVIYYGLSSASMASGGYVTSSPATITGLTPGKTYIFYIQNYVSPTDTANSTAVTAVTKDAIGYFAWTNDDATNIKPGQPVKNLTAAAWRNLIAKVAACGGSTASIPSASSGTPITANHFNQMRDAISGLTGAGSVASSVISGTSKILASQFANSPTALKEAMNRAISAKNNE